MTRRRYKLVLLVLRNVLTSLSVYFVLNWLYPPASPPSDVQLTWIRPDAARISWNQEVPARTYCVSKEVGNHFVLIDCGTGSVGTHSMPLPPAYPADYAFIPHAGDLYKVIIYTEGGETLESDPALLPQVIWYYLPNFPAN